MDRPVITDEKISEAQRVALVAQDDETLGRWWALLNHWEWPEGLPDAEAVTQVTKDVMCSCRMAITNWIEECLGQRALLRSHNPKMTDAEFDDFYRGHYLDDRKHSFETFSEARRSPRVRSRAYLTAVGGELTRTIRRARLGSA